MSIQDPLFVIALGYPQYLYWCRSKGVSPHNGTHRFVTNVSTLRGHREIRILFVPGWRERRDWREIHNAAIIVGRRPS